MLFIVSTPIGNLEDITLRAIKTLQSCVYILCEDTRHSSHLLKHYEIKSSLVSFHQFNEKNREDSIIDDLKQGKDIALISDAGTPTFADPGYRLIRRCIEENIPFTSIPGASALLTGLLLSGLRSDRFQFCGFIPKKKSEQIELFTSAATYPGTSIFYESPKRLDDTLKILSELLPHHFGAIAKELTKKFETVYRGTFEVLLKLWSENVQKGEIVLMIEGQTVSSKESFIIDHELELILSLDFEEQKESLKELAQKSGHSKRELYKMLLIKKQS